jgi:hypothetical protein
MQFSAQKANERFTGVIEWVQAIVSGVEIAHRW